MPKGRWMLIAVALQILFLVGMAGRHQFTLATGVPMLLKTAPVDPRDVFRGDYVRLNYAANQVPFPDYPQDKYYNRSPVWVIFQPPVPGDKYWQPVSASDDRPVQVPPGHLVVRASALYHEPGFLRVEYGFEQFFVPEGQGRDLERDFQRLDVEVMVDRYGRAALRQVFYDGKPVQWK